MGGYEIVDDMELIKKLYEDRQELAAEFEKILESLNKTQKDAILAEHIRDIDPEDFILYLAECMERHVLIKKYNLQDKVRPHMPIDEVDRLLCEAIQKREGYDYPVTPRDRKTAT